MTAMWIRWAAAAALAGAAGLLVAWAGAGKPPLGALLRGVAPTGEELRLGAFRYVEVGPGWNRLIDHSECDRLPLPERWTVLLREGELRERHVVGCRGRWKWVEALWVLDPPITNAQIEEFLPARMRVPPGAGDDDPALVLHLPDGPAVARLHARWLGGELARTLRLPIRREASRFRTVFPDDAEAPGSVRLVLGNRANTPEIEQAIEAVDALIEDLRKAPVPEFISAWDDPGPLEARMDVVLARLRTCIRAWQIASSHAATPAEGSIYSFALAGLAREAERRIREADRISWRSASEPGTPTPSEMEARMDAFGRAAADRWGFAGSIRELRRRPAETLREVLAPEAYAMVMPPDEQTAAAAFRVPWVLRGGLECSVLPMVPRRLAEWLGDAVPPGCRGGFEVEAKPRARIAVFVARDDSAASAIRDRLLEAEGTEALGNAVMVRERLVGCVRLLRPNEFYTDAEGLGRRVLALAAGAPPPAPEPWEVRWWARARAGEFAAALADLDPRVRHRAARHDALRVGFPEIRMMAQNEDPLVRARILEEIPRLQPEEMGAEMWLLVFRARSDPDPQVRKIAERTLVVPPWPAAVGTEALLALLPNPDAEIRRMAVETLASRAIDWRAGVSEARQALAGAAADPDATVRQAAAAAMKRLGEAEAASGR